MRRLDLTPLLPAVHCPALILCGEQDRTGLRAEELAGLLPRAAFRKLAETGHEANTQAPETLAKTLSSFYAPFFG